MTTIIDEDIRNVLSDSNIPWKELKGKTVLITGATGLIGSFLVKTINKLNKHLEEKVKVIAVSRDPIKAKEKLRLSEDITYTTLECCTSISPISFIIHSGSPTSSEDFANKPVEVIKSIIGDSIKILELAKERDSRILFLSTLEIYGITEQEDVKENDSGHLLTMCARSSYPEAKRMAETLCYSYYKEFGVSIVVARLTQCFGAGVDLYIDKRVFAEFGRNIINNENLSLKTSGETARSYIYISDAASALFLLLLRGKSGEAYNISNPQTYCSIKEMAELLAKSNNLKVVFLKDSKDLRKFFPAHQISLNIEKISSLGWSPRVSLLESYRRMIKNMKQSNSSKSLS